MLMVSCCLLIVLRVSSLLVSSSAGTDTIHAWWSDLGRKPPLGRDLTDFYGDRDVVSRTCRLLFRISEWESPMGN